MEVAGPLGTPLGLAQRKRASPRGEAGTSGFLRVSDSDRRVPAELGQESQASSCLRKGTPLASRVAQVKFDKSFSGVPGGASVKELTCWDFPGGPGAKTPCSQCRGSSLL